MTTVSGSAEIGAADELVVDLGPRELVEPKPLAARASECRAGAERKLDSPVELKSASPELCERFN
jgi:hypothetical protein